MKKVLETIGIVTLGIFGLLGAAHILVTIVQTLLAD